MERYERYTEDQIVAASVLLGILISREYWAAINILILEGADGPLTVEQVTARAISNVIGLLRGRRVPEFPNGIPEEFFKEVARVLCNLKDRRLV